MATIDMLMPKMGESIAEATIVKWTKNVGDKVKKDEIVLEISTDKVDSEVPAPAGGVLTEILYKTDDVVEVGKVIARISDSATATPSAPAASPAPAANPIKAAPAAASNAANAANAARER